MNESSEFSWRSAEHGPENQLRRLLEDLEALIEEIERMTETKKMLAARTLVDLACRLVKQDYFAAAKKGLDPQYVAELKESLSLAIERMRVVITSLEESNKASS